VIGPVTVGTNRRDVVAAMDTKNGRKPLEGARERVSECSSLDFPRFSRKSEGNREKGAFSRVSGSFSRSTRAPILKSFVSARSPRCFRGLGRSTLTPGQRPGRGTRSNTHLALHLSSARTCSPIAKCDSPFDCPHSVDAFSEVFLFSRHRCTTRFRLLRNPTLTDHPMPTPAPEKSFYHPAPSHTT
jgi:hypothetical protein